MTAGQSQDDVFGEWEQRLRINIDTHNDAERLYSVVNTSLSTTTLLAVTTLGVLAGAFDLGAGGGRGALIALTGIGAVAVSLQANLGYGAKAALHQSAARQYAALRRAVEVARQSPEGSPEREIYRAEILRQWDVSAGSVANVPARIRKRAKARRRAREQSRFDDNCD